MYFTDLAIQIIADDKIRSAIKRGEFDRLPGLGKPLYFDANDDPDWWIRRKLRDEGLQGELAQTHTAAGSRRYEPIRRAAIELE